MRLIVLTALLVLVAPAMVRGEEPTAYLNGPRGGPIRAPQQLCPDGNLQVHHDGSFEGGITWRYMGVVPPYYGAFGEAFDLGPGTVECISLWLTQSGWYMDESTDAYVWEGGVAGIPGVVLAMVSGIVFQDIPVWPAFGRFDVEIPVSVPGAATVGSWGNWPGGGEPYYWAIDHDGAPGYPWTHIAEGIGFPSGWQHPDVAWGSGYVRSMGIGVHFTPAPPVPASAVSWGRVKRLFTSTW